MDRDGGKGRPADLQKATLALVTPFEASPSSGSI
jgi:hypothetical protein